jgi:hypothetical protein
MITDYRNAGVFWDPKANEPKALIVLCKNGCSAKPEYRKFYWQEMRDFFLHMMHNVGLMTAAEVRVGKDRAVARKIALRVSAS